jgi:hypothetical protein
MVDTRRELVLINKHVRQRNVEAEERYVAWYEFRPFAAAPSAGSVYDDLFDEGRPGDGGISYEPPKLVPTIYAMEREDEMRAIPDARRPVQVVDLTILYKDMERSGVSNPWEYQPHLKDVFFYDDRFYRVFDYHVRGAMWGQHGRDGNSVIGVQGVEFYQDQDWPFEPDIPGKYLSDFAWPSTLPTL